jgi:hypothetical protein
MNMLASPVKQKTHHPIFIAKWWSGAQQARGPAGFSCLFGLFG